MRIYIYVYIYIYIHAQTYTYRKSKHSVEAAMKKKNKIVKTIYLERGSSKKWKNRSHFVFSKNYKEGKKKKKKN